MANLNFQTKKQESVRLSRITNIAKSGAFKVELDGITRIVRSTYAGVLRIGDTVLLNRTSSGAYFIVGKSSGLNHLEKKETVYRHG